MIYFGLLPIKRLFRRGNCFVFGERGDGKDVLFGNIIARSKKPYISNCDYTHDDRYIPLDFSKLDCGKNTWQDFLNGTIKYYEYPYPLGADIYISDTGVYLPSQYNGELDKKFAYLPTFFSLSRHVGRCNIHANTQGLSRPWLKLREQGRRYIRCRGVFKPLMKIGIVVQKVTIYSKYESGVACIEPCRITIPLLATPDARMNAQIYRDKFFNQHGSVKTHFLIYFNKSKHDTHHFEKILKEGKKYGQN